MANLKAIKIKITRGLVDGKMQNIYPDFNAVSPSKRDNMDWSHFFDNAGIGMHYDKVEGFGEGAEPGVQYAFTAVPAPFANEAISLYSDLVTAMDETEVETFFNERAHAHEPYNHESVEVLNALAAKKQLGLSMSPGDLDALDPDSPAIGIRKNKNKTWARYKAKRNITLV